MDWYNIKVYIPDEMGGTYTEFTRFSESAGAAMESVAEDNPDVQVIRAWLDSSEVFEHALKLVEQDLAVAVKILQSKTEKT